MKKINTIRSGERCAEVENSELNILAISALFHDIGKFYQRSGIKVSNENNYDYCPHYKQKISHVHTAFTAQFFDQFEDLFKMVLGNMDSETNITNISSNHHNPKSPFEWIVAASDRLASGMERGEYSKYSALTYEDEKQQYNYKKARLLSIFSRISLGDKEDKRKEKFYKLEPINPDIKPNDIEGKSIKDAESEYKKLVELFESDFKKLSNFNGTFNFNNFYNACSTLLAKYLWCVPSSSYHTRADVSLYDHMRSSSAIASALYLYHKKMGILDEDSIKNYDSAEDKFLLIQGDFSAIQDFIFSKFGESNKFASKILRAKSFFVSLSAEIAAYFIVNALGLNSSSIIMSAGGKFTILAPNLQDSNDLINRVKESISQYFFDKTFGQTKFNIASVSLSGADFINGNIPKKFEELNLKLNSNKLKFFPSQPIFTQYLDQVSKANGVCAIDGHLPKEKNSPYSQLTNIFKEMGGSIPKANYVNISFEKENRLQYSMFGEVSFKLSSEPLPHSDLIFRINQSSSFDGYAEKMIAYYIPTMTKDDLNTSKYSEIREDQFDESIFDIGVVKTFYHLAADARQVEYKDSKEIFRGKSFLAILKADIDNLGQIFAKGFGQNVSFADVVSLSRMFDYFFTAWLPEILKKKYRSIYTVFAGGDDLFLIGPYTEIVDLSLEIANHLKEYVGENPDIHISSGVTLKKPQIPVYQMAESAEHSLDKSKKIKGKNSITIFNITLNWEEYKKLKDMTHQIENFINQEVSTAYIYNILKFIEMSEAVKNGKVGIAKRRNALWIAYLNYLTVRNYKDSLKDDLLTFFYNNITQYGKKLIIPISLVLYKKRK